MVGQETLRSATRVSRAILNAMVRKKWLSREDVSAPQDATRTIKIALLRSAEGKLNDNQRQIIDTLAASGGRIPVATLQSLEVPHTTLSTLVRRGLVELREEPAEFTVSRTRPTVLTAGSSVSAMLICASGDTWRMRLAGTSNTASAPSLCATVTIIWPARTTSPASAPLAITEPGESANNFV